MFLFFELCHLMLSGNFHGSEIRHGIFGVKFWSREFWVLFEALGIFWVLIFAPIQSSPSLKIRSTPLGSTSS